MKKGDMPSFVRFAKTTHSGMSPFFNSIKEVVLGKKYDLSFAFVGPKKMRETNKLYRDKDYATDILSFELEKNAGEILICKTAAR